ncbi:MAG: VanW family protein [Clostridia bacterium]|nr:VanW family protein [Clostridia bacterium]
MTKRTAVLTTTILFLVLLFAGCMSNNNRPSEQTTEGSSGDAVTSTNATTTSMPADEIARIASGYITEYLSNKSVKVSAAGYELDIEANDVNAPFDVQGLMTYAAEKGLDSDILKKYLDTEAPARIVDRAYIEVLVDEFADSVDAGCDFSYEIGESGITIYRGKEYTVFDKVSLCDKLVAAFENFEYLPVEVELETVPAAYVDMNELVEQAVIDAKDAYYDIEFFESSQPGSSDASRTIVIEEVIGRGFDYEAVVNGMENESWDWKVYPFFEVIPQVTVENIDQQYFKDLLGTYTTSYSTSAVNRTTNLIVASEAVNGTIILPGQLFSFNDVVGERTAEKGYKEATIFTPNGSEPGLGGGICQLVSTTYAAALKAGLKQVQRYNHGYAVTYIPLGIDATVAWPYFDYRFRNDTSEPLKVIVTNSNGKLTVDIYGTQTVENRVIKFKHNTVEILEPEKEYVTDPTLRPGQTVSQSFTYGYVIETYMTTIVNGQQVSSVLLHTDKYYPNPKKLIVKVGPELSDPYPQD